MFVYSFKASTLKIAGLAALSLALLIVLIAIIPSMGSRARKPKPTKSGVVEKTARRCQTMTKSRPTRSRIAFLAQSPVGR